MRPVTKSLRHNEDGSPLTFQPYGSAKNDLLIELGNYCSFCEREGYKSSLDVEHIYPKSLNQYKHLEFRWDNFLVGCKNCNAIKGKKDVNADLMYLPHLNNLLTTIEVLEGGIIQIRKSLDKDVEQKTKAFVELVGIDRDPAHPDYSDKDDRWESRLKVWDIASDFCTDYMSGKIRLKRIIQMALYSGFWSVWLTVFKDHTDVKEALIANFPGTTSTCFDNDFNPISRP